MKVGARSFVAVLVVKLPVVENNKNFFQDFKFRQVLWSFFCGPKPRFLRTGQVSMRSIPYKAGKVDRDNTVSNNLATSNFTNLGDVTIHDSPDSENNLQTDL